MRTLFHRRRLNQIARWCRSAAWVIIVVGFITTGIYAYASIAEYINVRSINEGSALLLSLTTLASMFLALLATIFYAVLLFAISGMLDHYALIQMNTTETTARASTAYSD
jgi:hypothetical protein